jgi:dihydrofolate synthase / folylpolyglutamate synthase
VRFDSYDEALTWLESHVDFERVVPRRRVPSLDPVVESLRLLGDPQSDYQCVHVTGTNGKGTTSTLCAALFAASGLRVGTFTSPDLHAVNERIAVNAEPISDDDFVSLMSRLADVELAGKITLTRFELLTVAAFLHFSDEGVEVAVIEVGMGGTWDSTNVLSAAVAVVTNVDLDHTAVLGTTVREIASDKSGIIHAGAIAVVGTTNGVVVDVVRDRCEKVSATAWLRGVDFALESNELALGGRAISVRTPFATYEDVLVRLHGLHQGENAATAIVAAEALMGRALGEDVVREALGHATMAGRLEVLAHHPMIVVDGAHNPAGIGVLCSALDGAFHVEGTRRCVFGMLSGRDVTEMVAPLVEVGFREFFCCAPSSPRAVPASEVAAALRTLGAVAYEHPGSATALAHARERSDDDDLIVVTGSLYLVGEVRGEILGISSRHLH